MPASLLPPPRVIATPAALLLIERLAQAHGALMLYQSHGCCDGSTPMCFKPGEMALGVDDVQLGEVGGVPYHVGRAQLAYLAGSQLTLDAAPGSLGTFSLEDTLDQHFVARSRLWSDAEAQQIEAHERDNPLRPSLAAGG
jgi:uncharacterized protein (DUF779 family)